MSKLERTQKLINRNYASVEELSIQSQEEEVERLSIEEARRNKRLAELRAEAHGGHDPVARDQKPS